MKQNVLKIEVTAAPEVQTDALQAGKMYEHNATALCFVLDELLVSSEYRCYAEFVTVSGTARTEYLIPDAQNQITVELPVEVTSQMTALCVFNIVKISENGKTEQVIKAKTVRLYFSSLENTDRLIDENHTFSVNQLLEAIRQNTFKGEKGDKGDAYLLTDDDKEQIATAVNQQFYGLPLFHCVSGEKRMTLVGSQAGGVIRSLTVRPRNGAALSAAKLTFGENLLEPFLDSSRYNTFGEPEKNYVILSLQLKPNTEYILSKLYGGVSKRATSFLEYEGTSVLFCHPTNEVNNMREIHFTTGANGIVSIRTTGIYLSQVRYAEILSYDWAGLTLTEAAQSLLCSQPFSRPLYCINENITDCFDFADGKVYRNTAATVLTQSAAEGVEPSVVQVGTRTVYAYALPLPQGKLKKSGETAGYCNIAPTVPCPITANTDANILPQNGQTIVGLYFGTGGQTVIVYTEAAPEAFSAYLQQLSEQNTPLTVIYRLAVPQEETLTQPQPLAFPYASCPLYIADNTVTAQVWYAADISREMQSLEARIKALENIIEQGGI